MVVHPLKGNHPAPAVILESIGCSIMEKEVNDEPVRNVDGKQSDPRGIRRFP
jgi:hypothetical protein